jgi:hypothetical protein
MIQLSIDQTELKKQLKLKVEAIGEMRSPYFLEEVAKAAFVLVGESFVLAADRHAVQNPKKMHHVYEWKGLGNPKARLFVIERISVLGGNLIVESSFLPSKMPVPIDPELLVPGGSGRYVNKRNIFKNKASVMEKGLPITYTASSMMAFAGREGNMFLRPGSIVNIKNPGGIATKNSFTSFMFEWYQTHAELIMNSSGLYEKIANEASLVLSENNKGPAAIRNMVSQIVNSIAGNRVAIK